MATLPDTAEAGLNEPAVAAPNAIEQGGDDLLVPGGVLPGRPTSAFSVHLDNYEGPFDLLLGLISKHKLDVTEIAISRVTDEFVAYIRALGTGWDLGEVSEYSHYWNAPSQRWAGRRHRTRVVVFRAWV